jgi:hypothetical protein
MTPEERANRVCFLLGGIHEELVGRVRDQIIVELREAYEDAARIAEQEFTEEAKWAGEIIAAAVRARLMEQVKQPSQQITPDKPDSGEDS